MSVKAVLNSTHKIILDTVGQLPFFRTLHTREPRRDLEQALMDKRTLAQSECDGCSITCDAATFCVFNRRTWLLDKSDKLARSGNVCRLDSTYQRRIRKAELQFVLDVCSRVFSWYFFLPASQGVRKVTTGF
jgi:hypothetical protein